MGVVPAGGTACPDAPEEIRNRTLLLALADSGLRAKELLRLLVEDGRAADRGLFVRSGKGRRDRVAFIGPTTARDLKAWLARHPQPTLESFLFCDRRGQPLKHRHLNQIRLRGGHLLSHAVRANLVRTITSDLVPSGIAPPRGPDPITGAWNGTWRS